MKTMPKKIAYDFESLKSTFTASLMKFLINAVAGILCLILVKLSPFFEIGLLWFLFLIAFLVFIIRSDYKRSSKVRSYRLRVYEKRN